MFFVDAHPPYQLYDEVRRVRWLRNRVDRTEEGPGSSEPGLHYWVCDSAQLTANCPITVSWVYSTILPICRRHYGSHLHIPPFRNGINVNWTTGEGYQKHLDSTPCTYVLFLNTPTSGGELVLDGEVPISPVAGRGVVFQGGAIPHYVAPSSGERASLVVALAPLSYRRPDSLDEYVYG